MNDWTDEELKSRWTAVAQEYTNKAKEVLPIIQKINNLEKELQVLQVEIEKRGLNIEKENG